VHFIGEYFGLDAGEEEFALLWTDTRTGVQELFSDVVQTKRVRYPHIPELVAEILFGVAGGGGGVIIVGGKLVRVPPHLPLIKVLEALTAFQAAEGLPQDQQREARLASLRAARNLIEREIEQISHGH
jgi:hypothetical protein